MAEQIHAGPRVCALGFPDVSSRLSLLRHAGVFFFPFPWCKSQSGGCSDPSLRDAMPCPCPGFGSGSERTGQITALHSIHSKGQSLGCILAWSVLG